MKLLVFCVSRMTKITSSFSLCDNIFEIREKLLCSKSWKKRVRNSVDTKVDEEREKRCYRHGRRDSIAVNIADHGEAAVPLHPMKLVVEQVDVQSVMGSPWEACAAPGRTYDSLEGGPHAGTDLPSGLVTSLGTHAREFYSCKTGPHGRNTCWSS